MSSIVVAGGTSGSVTLSAPAVAGGSVLTLPVATDTLVGKATTDVLTNKTLTGAIFTATPATTTPQSMVRLNTANGYGSTNTVIRRFTNIVTNQGSDITYADSATLGATFTINTDGVYAFNYGDNFNIANHMGLSLNSTQLTTVIQSINVGNILIASTSAAASYGISTSWTGYLPAGSIVRAHSTASPSGTVVAECQFTVVRIA